MSKPPVGAPADQRAIIESLLGAGATTADTASRLDRGLTVDRRSLQQLVDAWIVREASRERYYVHEASLTAQRREAALRAVMGEFTSDFGPPQPFNKARFVKAVIFWLLMIAIPMILIQLLGENG